MFSSSFESDRISRLPFFLVMISMILFWVIYIVFYVYLTSKGYLIEHSFSQIAYHSFGVFQLYFVVRLIFARIMDMDVSEKIKWWAICIYLIVLVSCLLVSYVFDEYTHLLLIVLGAISLSAFIFLCLKKGKNVTQENYYSFSFHAVKIEIDSPIKIKLKDEQTKDKTIIVIIGK